MSGNKLTWTSHCYKLGKYVLLIIGFLLIMGCSISKQSYKTSFTAKDERLISNGDSLQPMRVFKITNFKDSLLLRTASTYIKPNLNDSILNHFVQRLYATVRDSLSMGVGIAAPQVGILKNIIWVQRFDKEGFPFEVYLNPKIIQYSNKKQTLKEGCLSIPNRSDTLNSRSYAITISYDTMRAEKKEENIEGFTSVIFQHEIDHLDGILYLDHLQKEIRETN